MGLPNRPLQGDGGGATRRTGMDTALSKCHRSVVRQRFSFPQEPSPEVHVCEGLVETRIPGRSDLPVTVRSGQTVRAGADAVESIPLNPKAFADEQEIMRHLPALRSGQTAVSGASRQKRFSNDQSKFLAGILPENDP